MSRSAALSSTNHVGAASDLRERSIALELVNAPAEQAGLSRAM